jgi:dipeptidyl aminopeptidase/acylaminoacyl peptidase
LNPSARILSALTFAASLTLAAQQPRVYTAADYAQAEKFMSYNTAPLAYKGLVAPHWMPDGRLWYRAVDSDADASSTYRLVDPAKKTNTAAFDQTKLAAALNAASAKPKADPAHLRFTELAFSGSDTRLRLVSAGGTFDCTLAAAYTCTAAADTSPAKSAPLNLSPDKTKGAFIRDWNLWVRDLATGAETQLTTDGVKDFGYATDNAGWKQSSNAILLWSPDSKKIATFQQDQRKDGEMYLVPVTNTHPELKAWKYPLVGDENITMIERVLIDVASKKVVRLKIPPDQHRGSVCDDVACKGSTWEDVQWSPDSTQLAFLSTARDHKREELRVADAATGEVRHVMAETAKTFLETGDGAVNWRALFATDEVIWFSDRDNWGQLYLYDLNTGRYKTQITHGEGNVTQVLHVDEKNRVIYFLGVGKETGKDPYFVHLYSVNFDGTGQKLLTPEDANHTIAFSPDFAWFTDIASTPTTPAVTTIRTSTGALAMEVARQDISKLSASGWVPPTPITVKARDGKTDLYGLLFKPTNFDPAKKYPVVNHIYPGPQTGSCGPRSFATARGDSQALAELGFIVVCIDGMGTNLRSKSFHETYYGRLGDNTLPDQITGMKQLAAQYPWIDLNRAGIYGHSGGGNATATAMFNYPDFFKVGISESGNHDQRNYEDDWAEKWAGLLKKNADGTSNYDSQANQNIAKNLKGHLLLAHGTMDDNVPPNNTLLVVDALIKANKDFDLLMIPNAAHGYGAASQYMTRRRWDYFVRYLAGATPPNEYEMKPYAAAMAVIASGPSGDADLASGLD